MTRPSDMSFQELTSSTVTDVWSLCCLLPIRLLISTLVRHAARQGRVRHHDPLTMSGHGIVGGQASGVELSLSPPIVSTRPAQRKRKTQRPSRTSSTSCSPLFIRYNPCFPLAYKRESMAPYPGSNPQASQHITLEPQTHS